MTVLAVGGCGSPEGDAGKSETPGPPPKSSSPQKPAVPRAQARQLPPAFDGAKGWAVMQTERLDRPAVAPHAKLVLLLKTYPDGKALGVEARDAATGAVRWSSAPWKPSARPDEFRAEDADLGVTSKGGKDFVVLAVSVREGKDALNQGKPAVRLAVFPADSSGTGVAPAHQVRVPGTDGGVFPHDTDGTVTVQTPDGMAVVDAATGTTTPSRGKSTPEFAVRVKSFTQPEFAVADAWAGQQVVPSGAASESGLDKGVAYGVRGGYLVARWPSKNQDYNISGLAMNYVWALHDERTGKPTISVTCDGLTSVLTSGGDTILSDNGRYLVNGDVAFDLQAGKGYCFGETESRAGVQFRGVDNSGTAYGAVTTSGSAGLIALDLATGKPTKLDGNVTLPTRVTGDVALYEDTPVNEKAPGAEPATHAILSVYPRR
ncbi:hypothetical protein [Streptomyces sp. NBC_00572]|uniref:hypothetical protein n=1 Tax=Streptomyces sp. NBC_00572 TaxID=2903664 RepID=UPI0022517758|nr:hypothetical protein [Streptomyces sp. NBC_00572]MCX4984805.1 hypothetical protein [Streptomyces sp. NBC_00572]